MANSQVPWSEKEKDILREFWESETSTVIAAKLGKTRNAIIGMARRLKLAAKPPGGGGNHGKPAKPRAPMRPRISLKAQVRIEPVRVVLPSTAPIPFLDSTHGQCRAIVDGRGPDGLPMVCGQPIQEGTTYSWCPAHHAKYTYRRV